MRFGALGAGVAAWSCALWSLVAVLQGAAAMLPTHVGVVVSFLTPHPKPTGPPLYNQTVSSTRLQPGWTGHRWHYQALFDRALNQDLHFIGCR